MIFYNSPSSGNVRVWALFIRLLVSVSFFPVAGSAQHHFVFYHMDQVPQSGFLNPGYIPPVKFTVGLPFISNTAAGFASNGFTYNQVRTSKGLVFEEVDYAGLTSQTGKANQLLTSVESQLFGLGIRLGEGFISLGVREQADFSGLYPADFMQLLADVQQNSLLMPAYELSELNISGTHYRSFSLGYTHQVGRLSAGLRVRYLTGLSNIWTINRGVGLQDSGDSGFFQVEGEAYFLSAGLSGIAGGSLLDYFKGAGNQGFGADLGLVYRLTDEIELSASALNLGVIKWTNDITYRRVNGALSQFSRDDLDALGDEFGEIIEDLAEGISVDGQVRYQTPLVQQYFLGGRYFFRPGTSLGLLFNPRVSGSYISWGASVSGSARVGNMLGLSLAYSVFNQSYFNLGGGFSLDLGPVQLFAASDNLLTFFRLKDAYSGQARVGINLNFGKVAQERQPEAEPVVDADFFPSSFPSPPGGSAEEEDAPGSNPIAIDPFSPANENTGTYLSTTPSGNTTPFLHGVVREELSREVLKSIVLELYTLDNSGQRTLVYANGFYSGRFSVPLQRGAAHLVIINKHGYQPAEVVLRATEGRQEDSIKRAFTLSPARPPVPQEELKAEEQRDQPVFAGEAPSLPASSLPEQEINFYDLTESTSLRKGPTHKTDVLLRFKPGDRVELLEKHDRWWWRVRFEGRTGYVKAFLLVPVN